MQRLRKPFLRLHWQLTLKYMLVTLAAFVMVLVIVTVAVWYILANSNLATIALISLTKSFIAPSIVPYLDTTQSDIRGLEDWLQATTKPEGLSLQSPVYTNIGVTIGGPGSGMVLLVLDRQLVFLAGAPELSEESLQRLIDESEDVLAAAQAGEEKPERISYISYDQSLTLAVPVTGKKGDHLGIVVLRMANPPMGFFRQILSFFGTSALAFTIAAGIIGAVFGFITSRGLTRRLRQVSQATDHWSQGDFSTFIQDRSEDELGQLAQQLNRMAEQLQNLLHTRQELAAIEERNRLARDLHDSVKQQVFATVMQVGAAREMIPEDAETAIQRLDEAERLSRQAQAELTTIIQELRPATLPERNFSSALKEYITDWSQLNKIDSEFRMGDECSLPAEVEQAIFRVTQEALSNVARHSQATRIEVDLVRENDVISISIADNGVGFVLTDRAGKGIGLISMRERVEAIGGEFSVKSTSEQGTQIIARCPIERSVS